MTSTGRVVAFIAIPRTWKELRWSVQPLDRNIQIGYLTESLPVEQRPPLVDTARIHLRHDLLDYRTRVPGSLRVAFVNPRAAAFRPFREKRTRLVEIDSELLSHIVGL